MDPSLILKSVVETLGVEETKRRIDELTHTPLAGVKSRTRRYEDNDDDTESSASTRPSKKGKVNPPRIVLNKPRLEMLGKAFGGSMTKQVEVDFRNYLINLQSVGEYNPENFENHVTSFAVTKAPMTDVEPAAMAGAGGPPPPPVKVKKEKKQSRILRIYAKDVTSIRNALRRIGVDHTPFTDDYVKDEFRKYVDNVLSQETFDKLENLDNRIQSFAAAQKALVSPPEVVPKLDVKDIQPIPRKEIEDDDERYISGLFSGPIARDTHENRWVVGKDDLDDDEDSIPITHKGVKYTVGARTNRVHRINADGVGDVLVGFVGIGEFEHLELPKEDDELVLSMKNLAV